MPVMQRATIEQIDAASEMLATLAAEHGLSNVRHGDEAGQVVVDVAGDRDYLDVVAFMDDIEGRIGLRPDVLPSGAPAARPGRPVGSEQTHAA